MTLALCFNCGATKFGAICPCPKCEFASTGDMSLDIAFSDHHLSKAALEAFGNVIAAIRRVCDDDELRFWSFIHYVSTRYPDILGVNLPADQKERCEAVVAQANPPFVTVEESERTKMLKDLESREDVGDEGTQADSPHA